MNHVAKKRAELELDPQQKAQIQAMAAQKEQQELARADADRRHTIEVTLNTAMAFLDMKAKDNLDPGDSVSRYNDLQAEALEIIGSQFAKFPGRKKKS